MTKPEKLTAFLIEDDFADAEEARESIFDCPAFGSEPPPPPPAMPDNDEAEETG